MILKYEPLIPETKEIKDFSKLENLILNSETYKQESLGKKIYTSFIRGSTIGSWNEKNIIKEHKNSDIDIVTISNDKNRKVNQYIEKIDRTIITIDVTNINLNKIKKEIEYLGIYGFTSINDLVMDSTPLENKKLYKDLRNGSLYTYLIVGLNKIDSFKHKYITPSGAMKLINQIRLEVNPLKWWSVEYSFFRSEHREKNKRLYYNDIESMLNKHFIKAGEEKESIYKINKFENNYNLLKEKLKFYFKKIEGRFHSSHVVSLKDIHKIKNKLLSLIIGLSKKKYKIENIFEN